MLARGDRSGNFDTASHRMPLNIAKPAYFGDRRDTKLPKDPESDVCFYQYEGRGLRQQRLLSVESKFAQAVRPHRSQNPDLTMLFMFFTDQI